MTAYVIRRLWQMIPTIAGVILLSPKNSAAPKRPSAASVMAVGRPRAPRYRRGSVMSAMMLPPPSLSARITSVT